MSTEVGEVHSNKSVTMEKMDMRTSKFSEEQIIGFPCRNTGASPPEFANEKLVYASTMWVDSSADR